MLTFQADADIIDPCMMLPMKRIPADILREFPANRGVGKSKKEVDGHSWFHAVHPGTILPPCSQEKGEVSCAMATLTIRRQRLPVSFNSVVPQYHTNHAIGRRRYIQTP